MNAVMQVKLIILYSGVLLSIYIIALLLVGPLNFIGKVIMRGLFGGTAIFAFNYMLELLNLDFCIGVNAVTSLITGYLGIFGIAVVSCIKYIFT
jgi:inhibitor of the pro-sigma K processing machinery